MSLGLPPAYLVQSHVRVSAIKRKIFERDSRDSPLWVQNLWNVERPPRRLFIAGREDAFSLLEKLPARALAVVGTRTPQRRSLELVERTLKSLRDSGLVIVSGFALGVDAVAHEGAIKNGLKTIAVLGTGLNSEYPLQNQSLRRKILDSGGLIISEFDPDDAGKPDHFIRRNRLIAQWSQATWVVEAPVRSGALNTAAWARNAGKFVFATPAFPGDPAFLGNQKLMERDHAIAFWDARSLGASWLEFSNWNGGAQEQLKFKQVTAKEVVHGGGDSELLLVRLVHESRQKGGAEVSDLLDWAINEGWTPQRFFEAAQRALESEGMVEKGGMWTPT